MAASVSARREATWQLRTQNRMLGRFRRELRREILRRYRAAREGFVRDRFVGADDALRGHEDAVREILRRQQLRVVQVFGPHILDGLKGEGAYSHKDFEDDLYAQLVQEWLDDPARGAKRVTAITQTTRQQIREVISRGVAEGLGVDAIARQMRSSLGGVTASLRAHVIARTETHNAAMFASEAAAVSSGVQGLEKEWVSVGDDRTRGFPDFDHAAQDGTRVAMEAEFLFTREDGSSYILMRPGDPEGPASGTIMCRCVLAYHPPEVAVRPRLAGPALA